MIVELTETDASGIDNWLRRDKILAWRAFGQAISIHVNDPVMVIDGDGTEREPVTGRYFYLEPVCPEKAERNRYLSLGHAGCWEGGAIRSLSPHCTYISYSVHPNWPVVEFHGWYRPRKKSRLISPSYEDRDLLEKYRNGSLQENPEVIRRAIATRDIIYRYGIEPKFLGREDLSPIENLVLSMQRLIKKRKMGGYLSSRRARKNLNV